MVLVARSRRDYFVAVEAAPAPYLRAGDKDTAINLGRCFPSLIRTPGRWIRPQSGQPNRQQCLFVTSPSAAVTMNAGRYSTARQSSCHSSNASRSTTRILSSSPSPFATVSRSPESGVAGTRATGWLVFLAGRTSMGRWPTAFWKITLFARDDVQNLMQRVALAGISGIRPVEHSLSARLTCLLLELSCWGVPR